MKKMLKTSNKIEIRLKKKGTKSEKKGYQKENFGYQIGKKGVPNTLFCSVFMRVSRFLKHIYKTLIKQNTVKHFDDSCWCTCFVKLAHAP